MPLLNSLWHREWSPDILVEAAQTSNRIGLNPSSVISELQKFERMIPGVVQEIKKLANLNRKLVRRALAHLAIISNRQ
jgi:hypothetical protein